MGLILKQSQVAGNNATQVQIGTINEDPVQKKQLYDSMICDIAEWIKIVGVLLTLPGICWFSYGFVRMVILDIYHRCAGTWWIYVFWTILGITVGGYLLAMLGSLMYKRHHHTVTPV